MLLLKIILIRAIQTTTQTLAISIEKIDTEKKKQEQKIHPIYSVVQCRGRTIDFNYCSEALEKRQPQRNQTKTKLNY